MTTLLSVPIRVRDTVYGNVYLADKTGGAFTDRDEEMVSALASAARVSIENARLYARLRAATEDFQRRLLPQMPRLHGWELQAWYHPSSQAPSVGGDRYDVIHLPDRVPCLMVGDVMGHDLRAATVMSNGAGRRLRWASAGHLPPLLAVPGEPARYVEAAVGPPLGVAPDAVRPDHEHRLPVGATVLLHTEGLIEDRAHTLDEGMQGAARIATDHADRPLPQLCDALPTRCRQAGEHDAFEDDVALLAARLAPNRLDRSGSPEGR